MKAKKVIRYYCDHCGKGHFRRSSAARHERGCTLNPDRSCGFCRAAELVQKPMQHLKDAVGRCVINSPIDEDPREVGYPDGPYKQIEEDLTPLQDATRGCPACMLAALRQTNSSGQINFKAAATEWMQKYPLKYEPR